MKKITHCHNTYVFESVKEVVKNVDLEAWREDNGEWLDELIGFSINDEVYYIVEFLEKNGFYDVEPCWSFSYSQGDGASFTAKWERPDRWLLKKAVKDYFPKDDEIADIMERLREITDEYGVRYFEICNNEWGYRYCHSNSKRVCEVEFEADEYTSVIEETLDEVVKELMEWFENRLKNIAYYEYSDEEIAELIVSNEWEIDEKYLKK